MRVFLRSSSYLLFVLSLTFGLLAGCADEERRVAPDAGEDARGDVSVDPREDPVAEPDVAPPSCRDDGFEDNDTAAGAAAVSDGSFTGLRLCPGDDDYLSIVLSTGDQLTVAATFLHAEGNIDLELFNPESTLVASSASTDDNERIEYTAAVAGTFTIGIRLQSDLGTAEGNDYNLSISVVRAPTTCGDDGFEDNDSPDAAAPVDEGVFTNLRVCPGDDDFYTVVLSTGDQITIDLTFTHAEGDLDLGLVDPAEALVAVGDSSDDNEQVVHTATEAGTYLIWVNFYEDLGTAEGNSYDMEIAIGPATTTCGDDLFENNDSVDDPASVDPGSFENLRVCPGDSDYYAINLSAGDDITVDLTFSHAEGNIDLRLVDPEGEPVAVSDSTDDNEQIVYTAAAAGTHVIGVEFPEDTGEEEGNDYDMDIVVGEVTTDCDDDLFEDNDSYDDPAPIEEGAHGSLRVCVDDDDFYSIVLSAGDRITIDLTFSQAEGDLDLGLINPEEALVAGSASEDDNEQVIYTAAVAGTFIIWVNFWEDHGTVEGNDYSLDITVVPASTTCDDDLFEDNDSEDEAAPVDEGILEGLRVCALDDDFYSLVLSVGDQITVDLFFEHDEGDIDVALINPEGSLVAFSDSEDDNEQLVYAAAVAGTFVIWVNFFADLGEAEGNDYDLEITVVPATTTCDDDVFEDNDSEDEAAPVDEGAYAGLRVCPLDDDFYTIVLSVGDQITVDLTFSHAEGDIDLGLINPEGALVAGSGSEDDDEQVVYTAAVAGTFVIWVNFYTDLGSADGNDYDLDIIVVPAATTCDDDGFEPNDSFDDPAPVEAGSLPGLRMCPDDDDFYSIVLSEGDTITVDLAFSHAEGDIDVALVNPAETLVAYSETTDDNEQIVYTAAMAGQFVIWVILYEDLGATEGNTYGMDIDVEPAATTCDEDLFEENDSAETAAPVNAGSLSGLRMCFEDDDYYSIVLSEGDTITIDLTFSHAEGDIDVALRNPAGTLVAFSDSTDNNEQIVYTAAMAGRFVIWVLLWEDLGSADGNTYGMDIDVEPAATTCAEDAFEPNDSAAEAAPVEAGSLGGLRMCLDDEDYYSIVLSAGDTITVDVTFTDAEGDIDLGLFNPNGTLVAFSESVDDDEQVVYTAAMAGRFVIWVFLYEDLGDDEGNDYGMDIDVEPAVTECEEDLFENNDTAETASPVTAGSLGGLRMCFEDDDYYSIVLSEGDTINIDVSFSHAEGDIDLVLINPAGTVVAFSETTDDDEEIGYTAVVAGRFVIVVYLYEDLGTNDGNDYGMDIDVVPAATTCAEDVFEDNDSADTATRVAAGTLGQLRMCLDDDDFYRIVLSAGDELTVDLTFTDAEGDIDVGLISPAGNVVASSESGTDNEQIEYTAEVAGVYFIWVFLYADDGEAEGNGYAMDIDVVPAITACVPDIFEDNDSLDDPAPVEAGPPAYGGLTSCPDDFDYYSIVLSTGDEITVFLDFVHAEGDIDLALYNPNGTLVASSVSTTDDEQVVYTALIPGTFVIRVRLWADAGSDEGNEYSMSVAVESAPTNCVDDTEYEDNDSLDNPARVVEGLYEDLRMCPDDDDFFTIALSEGEVITVDLLFDHAEGDIDLVLFTPRGTVATSSTSVTDDEQVEHTAAFAGAYVIWVYLDEDLGSTAGNDYDMNIDVEPVTTTCTEDRFEENDSIDAAAELVEGDNTGLRACGDDADFYWIILDEGEIITVDVLFTHAEGDIDVQLGDPEGYLVGISDSDDDDEQIVYEALVEGFYYILVYLYQDLGDEDGNDYEVSIQID